MKNPGDRLEVAARHVARDLHSGDCGFGGRTVRRRAITAAGAEMLSAERVKPKRMKAARRGSALPPKVLRDN